MIYLTQQKKSTNERQRKTLKGGGYDKRADYGNLISWQMQHYRSKEVLERKQSDYIRQQRRVPGGAKPVQGRGRGAYNSWPGKKWIYCRYISRRAWRKRISYHVYELIEIKRAASNGGFSFAGIESKW